MPLLNRRVALGGIIAGGLGSMLPESAGAIPFDGWDFIRPRCRPLTQARMEAYLRAWEQIRRQRFAKDSDAVVPVMRAAELLYAAD